MLLVEHLKDKTQEDVEYLESMHMLADLSLRTGDLDSALTFGKRALEGRKKALGRRHELFFESVVLLVKIYIAKGDVIEADGYTVLLPSSYEYSFELQGKLLRKPSYGRAFGPWPFM